MVTSKNKPSITRSKIEGIVRIPYNINQVEKENIEGSSELVYEYNELKVKDEKHDLSDVNYWKTYVLNALNQDLQTYLYTKYDVGTQISFQAIETRADTPQAVKDGLAALFTWISGVMEYYYTKKINIRDGEDWESVTWDFTTFNATDPNISLEALMGPQ